MRLIPSQTEAVAVPATIDWVAISKTIAIELVFIGSSAAVITGHGNPDTVQIAWATGLALGILRVSDIVANVVNVRAFLNKPASGVVPQAFGTPLTVVPKNGNGNGNGGGNGHA